MGKVHGPLRHVAVVTQRCRKQSPSPDRWIFESRLGDVGISLETIRKMIHRPRYRGLLKEIHRLAGGSDELPIGLE
jgi:hypothetical protein